MQGHATSPCQMTDDCEKEKAFIHNFRKMSISFWKGFFYSTGDFYVNFKKFDHCTTAKINIFTCLWLDLDLGTKRQVQNAHCPKPGRISPNHKEITACIIALVAISFWRQCDEYIVPDDARYFQLYPQANYSLQSFVLTQRCDVKHKVSELHITSNRPNTTHSPNTVRSCSLLL